MMTRRKALRITTLTTAACALAFKENLASGQAEQVVSVGVAPYAICCPRPDRCYVTNWGGDLPREGDPQALTSGTPVRIDPRTGRAV